MAYHEEMVVDLPVCYAVDFLDKEKWSKNGEKVGIYGFVAIKSAQCSKSKQSREMSPSMPLERARNYEFN
nr:hypothetical protein [Tanacetum cinerariifolium]